MFVSMYSFGIQVKGDVLLNVEEVDEWESYLLRAIFLLVMATHTPFIYFIGKESLLAICGLFYRRYYKWRRKKRKENRRKKRIQRRKQRKETMERNGKASANNGNTLNQNLVADSYNDYEIIKSGLQNSDSSDSEDSDTESVNSYQSETEIDIITSVDTTIARAVLPITVIEEDVDSDNESDDDTANEKINKSVEDI